MYNKVSSHPKAELQAASIPDLCKVREGQGTHFRDVIAEFDSHPRGMSRVRIVHGSGMGILRKALRQYLQHHPHVDSVTEAPSNEGGGGATLVELKI